MIQIGSQQRFKAPSFIDQNCCTVSAFLFVGQSEPQLAEHSDDSGKDHHCRAVLVEACFRFYHRRQRKRSVFSAEQTKLWKIVEESSSFHHLLEQKVSDLCIQSWIQELSQAKKAFDAFW